MEGTPEERWRSRAAVQLQYYHNRAILLQEVEVYAPPPEGNVTCPTDSAVCAPPPPLNHFLLLPCCQTIFYDFIFQKKSVVDLQRTSSWSCRIGSSLRYTVLPNHTFHARTAGNMICIIGIIALFLARKRLKGLLLYIFFFHKARLHFHVLGICLLSSFCR